MRKFDRPTAPFVTPKVSVPLTMRRVLYALIPTVCYYVWHFGPGLLINLTIAAAAALITEAIILRRRSQGAPGISDGSALVTAALLALALPPLVPWWIPALGAVIAISIAKHTFGGLGKNIFNPAMVAYASLLISFPAEMTQWIPPIFGDVDYDHLPFLETLAYSFFGILPGGIEIDALTRATPLDLLREGLRNAQMVPEIRAGVLFGDYGGRGWEWIAAASAAGGIYLLFTGTIRWQIPFAMLAGVLIPALFLCTRSTQVAMHHRASTFSAARRFSAHFSLPRTRSPRPRVPKEGWSSAPESAC